MYITPALFELTAPSVEVPGQLSIDDIAPAAPAVAPMALPAVGALFAVPELFGQTVIGAE